MILHLCKSCIGAFKEFIKANSLYILLGFGLLVGFVYQERALFVDELRLELYQSAIKAIKAYPILGQGSGAEKYLFVSKDGVSFPHTHNFFLSMMVNFGLLGLSWTMLFIISMMRGMLNNKSLLAFGVFLLPLLLIDSPFTASVFLMLMLMLLFLLSLISEKEI